jgi:hypothetical protein
MPLLRAWACHPNGYVDALSGGRSTIRSTIMERRFTISELETRWERALKATCMAAVSNHWAYRKLKSVAADIVSKPVDINDYFPTVENLISLLDELDPGGRDSIFAIFKTRIAPSSAWDVRMLRMECRDLLAHLKSFDDWRREKHHLRRVK